MHQSKAFGAVVEDALIRGVTVRFRAEGASMYPTIRDGETIAVAPVSIDDVVRGDILLYRQGTRWLAHRVVGLTMCGSERVFELRGDAKSSSDAPVAANAVVGRVVEVRRNGRLIRVCGPAARLRRTARSAASRARAFMRRPRLFSSLAPMLYGYHHEHERPVPSTRDDIGRLPA